jgi:hypothetical protein
MLVRDDPEPAPARRHKASGFVLSGCPAKIAAAAHPYRLGLTCLAIPLRASCDFVFTTATTINAGRAIDLPQYHHAFARRASRSRPIAIAKYAQGKNARGETRKRGNVGKAAPWYVHCLSDSPPPFQPIGATLTDSTEAMRSASIKISANAFTRNDQQDTTGETIWLGK